MTQLQTQSYKGGGDPSFTQMQIMHILCNAQNDNMQEVSNLAEVQIGFSSVEQSAGQASETAIDGNLSKIKQLASLSTILGVVTAVATGLSAAGASISGVGASKEAVLSSVKTITRGLGDGVGMAAEGGVQVAQSRDTKAIGDNQANSSVAKNLMKGLDNIGSTSSAGIEQIIQTSEQMSKEEQSIIAQDRQSKIYH